jgi:hypothetical protein
MEQSLLNLEGWCYGRFRSCYFFLGQAYCGQGTPLYPEDLQQVPPTDPEEVCPICRNNLKEHPPRLSAATLLKLGLTTYVAKNYIADRLHPLWTDRKRSGWADGEKPQYSLTQGPEGIVAHHRKNNISGWREVATFPYPVNEEQLLDTLVITHGWPLRVVEHIEVVAKLTRNDL